MSLPSLTTQFGHFSQTTEAITDDDIKEIDNIIQLYYTTLVTVYVARKQLFSYVNRIVPKINFINTAHFLKPLIYYVHHKHSKHWGVYSGV